MTDVNDSHEYKATRWVSLWLLLLGLALAVLGQSLFTFARQRLILGVAAYAASFIVLLILVRVLRGGRALTPFELSVIQLLHQIDSTVILQLVLLAIAGGAIGLAIVISQSSRPSGQYWPAFFAWLGAVAALTLAFVFIPTRTALTGWRQALVRARLEILVLFALTLCAFYLRSVDLVQIPYPFAGDEGSIGQEGQGILSGAQSNMFVTGWQSEASMSFLSWAVSMALFGQSIFGLRILAAVVGALTIPCFYLLLRSMFNRPIALLGATLLATMSTHIHFSRIAVNNVDNPFLACLVFWLVYRAIKTHATQWYGAAGMAAGLAMYTFVGSRLVLILASFILLIACMSNRTARKDWPKLVVFGLTAGLIVLPLGIYFLQHPDIAFARMNQVGILQNGWLGEEVQRTREPAWLVMARLGVDTFLAFVAAPARHGFYNSPGPLLDSAWALFFVLGLVFSLARIHEWEHLVLQLWFWSVIAFGGVLLVPPPSAERLSMAFPAVAALVAWGVWTGASWVGERAKAHPIVARGMLAAVGVVLVATSLNFYFFQYTPRHYYTDVNSEVAQELGEYLATVPREARVYFLGQPRMFYNFPSIPFLSGYLEGVDVPVNGDVTELMDPARPAIFVALPERIADLDQVRSLYPEGTYSEMPRLTNPGETLFALYTVDPSP